MVGSDGSPDSLQHVQHAPSASAAVVAVAINTPTGHKKHTDDDADLEFSPCLDLDAFPTRSQEKLRRASMIVLSEAAAYASAPLEPGRSSSVGAAPGGSGVSTGRSIIGNLFGAVSEETGESSDVNSPPREQVQEVQEEAQIDQVATSQTVNDAAGDAGTAVRTLKRLLQSSAAYCSSSGAASESDRGCGSSSGNDDAHLSAIDMVRLLESNLVALGTGTDEVMAASRVRAAVARLMQGAGVQGDAEAAQGKSEPPDEVCAGTGAGDSGLRYLTPLARPPVARAETRTPAVSAASTVTLTEVVPMRSLAKGEFHCVTVSAGPAGQRRRWIELFAEGGEANGAPYYFCLDTE